MRDCCRRVWRESFVGKQDSAVRVRNGVEHKNPGFR